MAALPFPLRVRGLNLGLIVFSLLVLGGAAYFMSSNSTVNYKSGAANTIQSATGKLVKRGTPAFSPCRNVTTDYGLIGANPTTSVNAQARTPQPGKPSAKPTPNVTPACTPLSVQASLAEPLVGQRVVATGTFTDGIFYATDLKLAQASPSAKPSPTSGTKPSLPPKANPRAY